MGFHESYKGILKFLKVVLFSMNDSAYLFHFGNARKNQIMKWFITSKIIRKINDNESYLPYFK